MGYIREYPPPPCGAPRYRSARAASLRYRNRAEITVFMCQRKSYAVWFSCWRMRKSYPVWCEDLSNLWLFTLEIGMTRHSLATSQKSPQNHRSCVWTEALSYPVWFSCRRMRKSYPVWCEDLSNLWLFTLEIGMTRHSLATSQKSPQSHRSCVWIQALSYPVWFSKRRKSYPL